MTSIGIWRNNWPGPTFRTAAALPPMVTEMPPQVIGKPVLSAQFALDTARFEPNTFTSSPGAKFPATAVGPVFGSTLVTIGVCPWAATQANIAQTATFKE